MQCRTCKNELVEEKVPGFGVRFICVAQGCPLGRHRRLDLAKKEARRRIDHLSALAVSTDFPSEKKAAEQ